MAVDGIARRTLGNQATVCAQDIGMRWTGVLPIVKKKDYILIYVTVDILQILNHVENIIVAATELSLLTNIINPDL